MRHKPLLLTFILMLVAVLGVSAQTSDSPTYAAAAYLPDSGTLLLMDESSIIGELSLPLPDGFNRNASTIAMLDRRVAYIARQQGSSDKAIVLGGIEPTERGGFRFISEAELVMAEDAAYTSFFLRAPGAFGLRDGVQHLALGYGLDPIGWVLNVYDGELNVVASLTQDALPDEPRTYGYTPYPIHFRPDGSIAFALVDAQATGPQTPPVFVWNSFTGAVTQTNTYAVETDVYTQSGELVSIANGGLQWFNSYSGELARFYDAGDAGDSLGRPRFVDDGRLVAVAEAGQVVLLGRDGVEIGALPGSETALDWYGLQSGMVMALNGTSGVDLVRVPLTDGAPSSASDYERFVQLPSGTVVQWVDSDMRAGVRAIEYTRWAALDGASFDSLVVSGVSPLVEALQAGTAAGDDPDTPTTTDGLFVGGWAETFSDEGDQLNVRSAPGTDSEVVTRVDSGVRVNLLEGPVEADGLVWWRVLFPTGRDGWVAQAVDGVQTLVAAAPPPTPTPTATPTQTPSPLPPTPAPEATPRPEVILNEIVNNSTGSSTVGVVFSWSGYPGASSYLIEVQYCYVVTNCTPGFTNNTVRTTFNATFNINNPTLTIRWRVTALDGSGGAVYQSGYKNSVVVR